jgi:hypothetical protein
LYEIAPELTDSFAMLLKTLFILAWPDNRRLGSRIIRIRTVGAMRSEEAFDSDGLANDQNAPDEHVVYEPES